MFGGKYNENRKVLSMISSINGLFMNHNEHDCCIPIKDIQLPFKSYGFKEINDKMSEKAILNRYKHSSKVGLGTIYKVDIF